MGFLYVNLLWWRVRKAIFKVFLQCQAIYINILLSSWWWLVHGLVIVRAMLVRREVEWNGNNGATGREPGSEAVKRKWVGTFGLDMIGSGCAHCLPRALNGLPSDSRFLLENLRWWHTKSNGDTRPSVDTHTNKWESPNTGCGGGKAEWGGRTNNVNANIEISVTSRLLYLSLSPERDLHYNHNSISYLPNDGPAMEGGSRSKLTLCQSATNRLTSSVMKANRKQSNGRWTKLWLEQ